MRASRSQIRQSYATLSDEVVQRLDPLQADALCRALPELNARADVAGLTECLRKLTPTRDDVAAYTMPECLAAMRDLGMFLGSLKRHGVEPLQVVGELTPVLVELGERTDMVPRDTVHHYIAWNPRGERERTYTDDPMESTLMGSVRTSLPALGTGVELCKRLRETDVADPAFAPLVDELTSALSVVETAIELVLRHVSPVFFAQQMRPYFEDIEVAGRRYHGPAAAHIPLSLIDLVLWASDHADADYLNFCEELNDYSLPEWRAQYDLWHREPSLVSRFATALRVVHPDVPVPAGLRLAGESLARALRVLTVFRGRHIRIARAAYAAEVGLYELGSGGGSIQMLAGVLGLVRENVVLVRAMAHRGSTAPPAASAVESAAIQ